MENVDVSIHLERSKDVTPTAEEIAYWESLESLAIQCQETAFAEEMARRAAHWDELNEKYEKARITKSNGHSLESWKNEFLSMFGFCQEPSVPEDQYQMWYDSDENALSKACRLYLELYPYEPDPEMEAQRKHVMKLEESLDKAAEKYRKLKIVNLSSKE